MKINKVLAYIGNELNTADITWGVGASVLLRQYDLIDEAHDIDLIIALEDIDQADAILKTLGRKKEWEKSDHYSTQHFYEYTIEGVDVDVMSGLALNHEDGTYNFLFDKTSIAQYHIVDDISIPFMSLEDWYVIYQLIPQREEKVSIIEAYLKQYGTSHRKLLARALDHDSLPFAVVNRSKPFL